MITAGDISPRRDVNAELYVAVLSNAAHILADTGRIITCPFIPGALPEGAMALVIPVDRPQGVLLPELVQWLPSSALGAPIGNTGRTALVRAATVIGSLLDQS